MMGLNHFMAFTGISVLCGSPHIPACHEENASHCSLGPRNELVCARASHSLYLGSLVNVGDSHTTLASPVTMLMQIQEDLTIFPEYSRPSTILLPSTSDRQSRHTHWFPYLENKAFSQTCGMCSIFLSKIPSFSLLLAQLFWSFEAQVLQGSPSNCTSLEVLSSSLPMISPSSIPGYILWIVQRVPDLSLVPALLLSDPVTLGNDT